MGVAQAQAALTRLGVPGGSLLIGGRFSVGEAAIDVLDPYAEDVIAEVPEGGEQAALAALVAARAAFPSWSATHPHERAAAIDRLADLLTAHGDDVAALASSEIGMPITDAAGGQVALPAMVLRTYADLARTTTWESRDASGTTVTLEPAGPVVAITPWNFPVHQVMAKLGPALAAGCTVVLKPSELTPLNALVIGKLCLDAGIPPGVVNIVTGTGAVTGQALLDADGWEVISFTGSLAVGRRIGAAAGARVARAALELGGKSPAVVLPDADLEWAVAVTVRNCFVNAGQKCNAPTRLLVPEQQCDRAVDVALATAAAYVLGDPLDPATTMGPLVSSEQRERVAGFVARAEGAGARVHAAAVEVPSHGYFYAPRVVHNVDRDAEIAREEVFGPVLTVLGYADVEDAVALANDSVYGLSAEVFAGTDAEAGAIARRLRAGQVRVNGRRTPMPPVSPFGGFRRSGLGRELGEHGLAEYLEPRSILGDPPLETS